MAYGNFILDKGYDADAALTKFRAVKRTSTGVTPVTASTDALLGIAQYGVTTDEIAKGKGASVREMGISEWEAGGAVALGAEVMADSSGRCVTLAATVAASLNTGVVANNNAITWTAVNPGTGGNSITVTLVDPGGDGSLGVDVDGKDIVVTLAYATGAVTSTAAQVIAAVLEHDTASQLVSVANKTGSSGAGVVAAVAKTNLAGGAGAGSGNRAAGVCVGAAASTAGDRCAVRLYNGGRVL